MKRRLTYFLCAIAGLLFAMQVQAQAPTFTIVIKTYPADCQLSAASVKVFGGTPPYSIQWSHGAIGDTVASLPKGDYAVTVTDNTGNDTTLGVSVDVGECKVTFNNRFTPNGDGINDTWGIGGNIHEFPRFLLQVYDRWGQLVHQQRGQYIPWDGTHLGLKVADATYYYIFFYEEGKSHEYEKGDVTIVR